jgi:uncharacterized membrane protein YgcG
VTTVSLLTTNLIPTQTGFGCIDPRSDRFRYLVNQHVSSPSKDHESSKETATMQTSFFLAAFLALVHVAVATPPACLLAALGIQSNPSDVKLLCDGLQKSMIGNLTQVCKGPSLDGAYGVYASTCQSVGVKVAALPTSSSSASGPAATGGSGSGSGSGSGTTTGTGSSPSASSKNAADGLAPSPIVALSGLVAAGIVGVLAL